MFPRLSNLHICLVLLISAGPLSDQGHAQQPAAGDPVTNPVTNPVTSTSRSKPPGLHGEGGLGLVINSGNSENENLSASLKLSYTADPWQHEFNVDAKQTTVDDTTTSKRTLFNGKTSYTFSPRVYTFAALRHDRDRFSGFEYQASGSTVERSNSSASEYSGAGLSAL
jgi:putative salt-induced outer membrane protein YdiY